MTDDEQRRQDKRRRLWLVLAAVVTILAVLLLPPLVSISSYKTRITSLMSASLGRPVRLSQVRLRLLPRPGFVLYDLTVDEDPEFGGEALLHASTVTASIRFLPLWSGHLQISEISVDEASLNLVRASNGHWNLESLFKTAANKAGSVPSAGGSPVPPLPYLAATNSRINFKNGAEKLPFSLVDTDLSFWQEQPGEWRIRLRGQPARTDVSLDLADTGVVELNASAHSAPALSQMPIQLDLEWRDAQLGQLTRLVTGTDAGWRGDLRGDVHVEGTPDAATFKTRLRAVGVHRAEFAPAAPMDFDANCGFVYHYNTRALEKLVCDSPLGDGRVQIDGDLPGVLAAPAPSTGTQSTAQPAPQPEPHFSVELDRVPVAAALDALRTVRSGVGNDLEAAGTASGKITYAELPADSGAPKKPAKPRSAKAGIVATQPAGPLGGSVTVEGLQLKGDGLSSPIVVPKLVLAPAATLPGQRHALVANVAVPMGGATPVAVNVHLGIMGYQVTARGPVSIARSREVAHAADLKQASALDALAGDPLTVDLLAQGPWLPVADVSTDDTPPTEAAPAPAPHAAKVKSPPPVVVLPASDNLSGTVTLHNDNWKADFLANHVDLATATLHLNGDGSQWDPVNFAYGPLKGTATLTVPEPCTPPATCPVEFQVQFGDLDAATVQTAILGAHEKNTLLSDLLNRLHPSAPPVWPRLQGTISVDSLILGPVTLKNMSAIVSMQPTGTDITSLDANLLGGKLSASGQFESGDKPYYQLTGDVSKLNPVEVGKLFRQTWRGGALEANGKIQLSGFTAADLASSAKGTLHFDWRHGAISASAPDVPAQLAHFDRWTADAVIADGKLALDQNEAVTGSRKGAIDASVSLTDPPKLTFAAPKPPQPKKPQPKKP